MLSSIPTTSSVVFTSAKIRAIVLSSDLVSGPIYFGYGIADDDHPTIVFDATPDGRNSVTIFAEAVA
jgi:hypothetical protein